MLVTSQFMFLLVFPIIKTYNQVYSCEQKHFDDSVDSHEEGAEENKNRTILPSCVNCTSNWTETYEAVTEGLINISCGKCAIYKLNVAAQIDAKCDKTMCWGLTTDLFTSSKNCLWKNTCIMPHSPSYIVWSPPNQPSCLGKMPKTINVKVSCLVPGTTVHDVLKGYQTIESINGLLQSHNTNVKSSYATRTNINNYIVDINSPADERHSWKNYFAKLYVLRAEIGPNDELTLYDPSSLTSKEKSRHKNISTWRQGDVHVVRFESLRFLFHLKNTSDLSTRFCICFQWFRNQTNSSTDLFNETIKKCKHSSDEKLSIPIFYVMQQSITKEEKGIIRSHATYPRNYPRPKMMSLSINNYKRSSYEHVLEAPNASHKHLIVRVIEVKLAEGDVFRVTNNTQKEVGILSPGNYILSHSRVNLKFQVLHLLHPTASGFTLCYQWFENRPMKTSEDLCEQFAFNVSHCENAHKKKLENECGLNQIKSQKEYCKGDDALKKKNKKNVKNGQKVKSTKPNQNRQRNKKNGQNITTTKPNENKQRKKGKKRQHKKNGQTVTTIKPQSKQSEK